jgi:2-aminophenol/2-amino-5-chlorophenol 1,6-dioxygenase subunit alpha
VPGSPLHLLRPEVPAWAGLVAAYAQAAAVLAAARPDVLLLYSTQWFAVLDELWQTRAHVQGVHVDENWYEFGDLPFDLRIDTEVAHACIEATATIGVRSKGVDYDGFPIDSGTIVACNLLDPAHRYPVVIAANNLYHDWQTTEALGALAAAQADRSGRRYAAIGIGGLSGTLFRHEMDLASDRLASREDDALNHTLLARLAAGDAPDLRAFVADYAARARADMGMKHLAFVLGASGGHYRGATTLGYGPAYGSGAAVIQFTP